MTGSADVFQGTELVPKTDGLLKNDDEDTVFRATVSNLPPFTSVADLRKILTRHLNGVVTRVRVRKSPRWRHAIVSFDSEEELNAAMKEINASLEWKKMKLCATLYTSQQRKCPISAVDETPKSLNDQVVPLHNLSYNEQLQTKQKAMISVWRKFRREMVKVVDSESSIGEAHVSEILPSPLVNGYRNKCEFAIGLDGNGLPVVGFMTGLFKDGKYSVLSAVDCPHVSEKAKEIALILESFIRQKSDMYCYDRKSRLGHWRLLMVRTLRSGDVMAVIQMHPQNLDSFALETVKQQLVTCLSDHVCSLQIQLSESLNNGMDPRAPYEVLKGPSFVSESLMGLQFRISPTSFFQVNTLAAEVLYGVIRDLCSVDKNLVLLDLCCGTGTISLIMAQFVNQVIGIELCNDAVIDARANAERNGVCNVQFESGSVESTISRVIASIAPGTKIVAIVDPPRSGLHGNVMRVIRNTKSIHHLIYVACSPENVINNFVDLCRPQSNKLLGKPFIPVKVQPVDMFPHTSHTELVTRFDRIE